MALTVGYVERNLLLIKEKTTASTMVFSGSQSVNSFEPR